MLSREEEARQRARRSLAEITPEEDAAINAGIAADPDTFELDDEWFAKARRGGRPKSAAPKESTTLRLDPDVLEHFKASGPGWQTRINAALRKAAGL